MWDPETVQPSLGRSENDLPGREMVESRGGATGLPELYRRWFLPFPSG